jgi:hypothetical protein
MKSSIKKNYRLKANSPIQRSQVSGWAVQLANPIAVKQLLCKPGILYSKHTLNNF